SIVIRKPTDYIPKMIELAGGRYAFENFVTDQTNTSVSVTMETFYGTAVDADVLIY
ncbi:MAG TPA: iron ABC transporter substrate-binding protein, partial [Clostridiales bacterium]|nr:iron ABC transporter substrate-binding protein [Clostridiales bacterium]